MKITTKIIAATLTVASLAAVSIVSAHPGSGYGMGGMGYGQGMGAGMMGQGYGMGPGAGMGPGFAVGGMHGFDSPAVMTARLGDLKAALKITPAQEPAWATYEAQARQQVQTRQAFHTAMLAQMQDPKVSVDHNAQHEAMSKLFAAQTEARNALYALLTPEQKAVLERSQGPGYGRRMGWQAPPSTK